MTTVETVEAPPTLDDRREEVRRRLREVAEARRRNAYAHYVNPHIGRTLDGLGLDVVYTRGEGTALFDAEGNRYLDFAGAYGALPFGHNPPEIWAAIESTRCSAEPSLLQPALLAAAGDLAAKLVEIAPGDLRYVWLCNSGAEAVEAAVKLARAATGRMTIVSTHDSFHGKTLGALSVTGRSRYQTPFGAPAGGFQHVPFGDVEALEELFATDGDTIAAFVIEPVQGEGGIVPAPAGYLAAARALCTAYGARLVVDEVQTGLGRCGRLFACEEDGVVPDIMPLAKALGGGVVPIGAVLFNEACLTEDFALRHTSTFGGNSFCSRIGLRSLEVLTADDGALVRHVAERGRQLLAGLEELAARHPEIVRDVRGRGLLLGVELESNPQVYPEQGLFRSLADQEGLVGFLCGYLLREEGIRIAPTYFAGSVLRVEPPLTVSAEEIDTFLAALGRGLDLIEQNDSARFFAHLVRSGRQAAVEHATEAVPTEMTSPRADEPRWAFIAHPTDAASYESYDRRLRLSGDETRQLFDRMNQCRNVDTPAAMLMGSGRVHAATGETSYGEVLALPYNARQLLDMPAADAVAVVQAAVQEAVERGAEVVGLGAYSSIVTSNATALADCGVPVTTGNAYTVASAVDGLRAAALAVGVKPGDVRCAVLGATGAIGRAASLLLAEDVGALTLVGNPVSPQRSIGRLNAIAREAVELVLATEPGPESGRFAAAVRDLAGDDVDAIVDELVRSGLLETTVDSDRAVAASELVLAATSTPELLIRPETPKRGAVICDVSQPPNVGPEILLERPDLVLLDGGLVELPGGHDLGVDFGVAPGVTYACTAETLILAHQLDRPQISHGERLAVDLVRTLRDEARRLGFRLHLPEARLERSPR